MRPMEHSRRTPPRRLPKNAARPGGASGSPQRKTPGAGPSSSPPRCKNRVDGLWAEFTARDDPAARAGLERDRRTALDELEQTRAELDRLDEEIADIREEARRAGAPPGWLR